MFTKVKFVYDIYFIKLFSEFRKVYFVTYSAYYFKI